MSPPAILSVANLARSYNGLPALRGVSFDVGAGELVALIGPNGAGKTTCFNLLNGQLAPDSGTIRLDGQGIAGLPPREIWRRGVGRTFQVAQTFGSMSVRENVQVALASAAGRIFSFLGNFGKERTREADALLAQVGMAEHAERACATLSYGDVKRVELALALASRPRLLLMDEPTAGMDAAERQALMSLVEALSRKDGIAVLFTEHDMDMVFGFATRVLVLHEGSLIAAGAPEAVRADSRVQEVYFGGA